MLTFVDLSHINFKSDQTTVNLFNACRPIKKDKGGEYTMVAVRPSGAGVMVEKRYVNTAKTI